MPLLSIGFMRGLGNGRLTGVQFRNWNTIGTPSARNGFQRVEAEVIDRATQCAALGLATYSSVLMALWPGCLFELRVCKQSLRGHSLKPWVSIGSDVLSQTIQHHLYFGSQPRWPREKGAQGDRLRAP